jgi:quinol monooxygenase YgiN
MKEEKMSALVVKNFRAAEGKFEALGDFFKEVLGDTRAYDGCIKIDVYVDESTSSYTLVEEWETFSAHDSYVSWRTAQGDVEKTAYFLDGGIENGLSVYEWGTKTDI